MAAGGPASRAVEFTAIAYAESGFRDQVVSPAGAIGDWQIMPFNGPPYGVSVGGLYTRSGNAHVAVRLSSFGQNCAPWDTCYRNINASGRYKWLQSPESGSAAYNNLSWVASAIGKPVPSGNVTKNPSGPPPLTGPENSQLIAAVNAIQWETNVADTANLHDLIWLNTHIALL